jgi:hypothetical protein
MTYQQTLSTPVVSNLFQDYSTAILNFTRSSLLIPRIDAVKANILSMTRKGTTGGGTLQNEIVVDNNVDANKQQLFRPGMCVLIQGTPNNNGQYVITNTINNVLIVDKNYKIFVADQPAVLDTKGNSTPNGTIKKCINVVYGNMDRAIAVIAQPLRNGTIDGPGAAVYLNECTHKMEKSRPVENYYLRRYKDNNGNTTRTSAVPPMQEYELTYTINIWAVYMQEMDIMIQQIVSQFNPQKFFWIGDPAYGMDYIGPRENRAHHGQWAYAKLGGVNDGCNLEPGDATQRTLRFEISISIESAYVPLPFDTDSSYIGTVDLESIIDNRIEKMDIKDDL